MDLQKNDWFPRPVEISLLTFGLLVIAMWCRTDDTPHQLPPATIPDSQQPLNAVRCRRLLRSAEVDDRLLEAALVRLARLREAAPARLWLQLSQERWLDGQLAANLLRLVQAMADDRLPNRLSQLADHAWAADAPSDAGRPADGGLRGATLNGPTLLGQAGDGFYLAADFLLRAERSVLNQMLGRRDRFDPHQWPNVLSAVRLVPLDRLSAGRRQQLARLTLACVRSDPSRPGLTLLSRLPVHAVPASQRGHVASWFVAELAARRQTSGHGQLVQACWHYASVMDAAKKRRLQARLLELGLTETSDQR
ncbi:MAG: hypothetical protein NXI04_10190 [Planctomycetaceae bacterium]|nr:hypothetical protein [Planctomycetaceae bacterium]